MTTPTLDFAAVKSAVDDMANAYGRTFIPAGVPLDGRLRDYAEALAITLHLTTLQAKAMRPHELIALYAMARKNPVAAQRKAFDLVGRHEAPAPVPAPMPAPPVDMELVNAMIAEAVKAAVEAATTPLQATIQELQARTPRKVEITIPKRPKIEFDVTHTITDRVLRECVIRNHVMLVGPAGSGKTTIAEHIAKALGLKFYMEAKVQTEFALLGYRDATGTYVRTNFREAYEHGGVFLFDEMDASNANALTAFNAALANGQCPFPDGLITKHKDFIAIAACNTFGKGANREYVGRTQIDAATLDRFGTIVCDYDPALEEMISPNARWREYVQAVRAEIERQTGIRHIVSPRASICGAKSIAAGAPWQEAADMWVYKGLDIEARTRLEAAVPLSQYEPRA